MSGTYSAEAQVAWHETTCDCVADTGHVAVLGVDLDAIGRSLWHDEAAAQSERSRAKNREELREHFDGCGVLCWDVMCRTRDRPLVFVTSKGEFVEMLISDEMLILDEMMILGEVLLLVEER